jgi:outer membrane lipoprotein-sorting protein
MTARLALAVLAIASGLAGADPAPKAAPTQAPTQGNDAPPASLVTGDAAHGAAIDPVFAHLKLERLSCKFSEEKHIALLARPLRSTGTIFFERERGIARATLTPRPSQVVLTRTALRMTKDGHSEEIPLDKSKDLKAFALIFPTLLRGERPELERAFDLALYGSEPGWWALAFTPKADSLKKLVKRVIVFGKQGEVVALQVTEASGDVTDTRLTDVRRNADVPDAELAAAFGAP